MTIEEAQSQTLPNVERDLAFFVSSKTERSGASINAVTIASLLPTESLHGLYRSL
ncbi:MAG TPA: hypothetical protein VGL94_17055 [Ktedonobacteraceae bacterium]|jgi:hypothetical protein